MQFYSRSDRPPLHNHPLLQTHERHRMLALLHDTYKVRNAKIASTEKPFTGIVNRINLNDVGLHFCSYGGDAAIEFSPMEGFRQFLCLGGTGFFSLSGGQFIATPEQTGIIPPFQAFNVTYRNDYAHLVLVFNPQSLVRQFELMSGHDINQPLALPTLETLDARRINRFRAIAMCLAYQFSAEAQVGHPAVRELEQALLTSFLFEHQHNFTHLLKSQPKLAAPWQQRVAEDFMEANWNKAITVENIAQHTGVSIRSVFGTFKRHRGCSPMEFLRDLRLTHARAQLLDAGDDRSVTAIGMACGFHSFGHFARHYREKFGELPSATLARSRRHSNGS